jgi:hypothetical protein
MPVPAVPASCKGFPHLALIAVIAPGAIGAAFAEPENASTAVDSSNCCSVFELRQYTLHPGQRDVLIELFDREFIEAQEAAGMRLFGQFRDRDRPDRFVWIRAFADMEVRQRALTAMYSGPVWKAHGRKAAATMIDADDVLLLRPVDPAAGFKDLPPRAPVGASAPAGSLVTATVYHLRDSTAGVFPMFFRETLQPALRGAGVVPLATFETEHATNTYPALPVREGEHVYVWFASFKNPAAHAAFVERLSRSRSWKQANAALEPYLKSPTQELRLEPTARSLLR